MRRGLTKPSYVRIAVVAGFAGLFAVLIVWTPQILRDVVISLVLDTAESSHNRPIRFYGRAVDQDGNGVPGVTFRFRYGTGGGFTKAWSQTIERTTDGDGRFLVEGITGRNLELTGLHKDGFISSDEPPTASDGGRLANTAGLSFDVPVTYRMWWKGRGARLIKRRLTQVITKDRQPYAVDLLHSKVRPGGGEGDLVIWAARGAFPKSGSRFAWEFEVEAVDGGLVETHDVFPYRPPRSDGYSPRMRYAADPADPGWRDQFSKTFYLRSRGEAVYASFRLDVSAAVFEGIRITIDYLANPEGAPNLEYDRSQEIESLPDRALSAPGRRRAVPEHG